MFKYVVKRVIAAIITLWALVTIVFFSGSSDAW